MTDNEPPQRSSGKPSDPNLGWAALGYLLAGIGVWGLAGWLVDEWLGISKHFGLMTGMVLGAAGGIYLVVKRLGG